jgi:peptide/nickel transport system substrate-binding protein
MEPSGAGAKGSDPVATEEEEAVDTQDLLRALTATRNADRASAPVTRRRFGMFGWRALVVSVVAAALPLSFAQAQARKEITVAVNNLPRGLEAGSDTGNVDQRVIYNIFDTLIRRDFRSGTKGDGAKLIPSLAESWTRISPTVLELKLRPNVVFHNGDKFTAEDVLFTFSPERMLGKDAVLPEGRVYFDTIDKVEKVDDLTVRIVTKKPDILLEQRLAGYAAGVVSARSWTRFKAEVEAENATRPANQQRKWLEVALEHNRWNPVGTGPYKLEKVQPSEHIRLVANDKYFLGQPAASAVTFKEVPELSARMAGLVSGEYDMIVEISPDQIKTLKSRPGIEVRSVVLENTHLITFNTKDPALADKRIRHALSLAIDRKLLIDALWEGQTYSPNGHQLPAFGEMYDPNRKGYLYDPEKAKALLKEAGYKGQQIAYRLIPNYYLNGVEAAQALQEMWRAVGLNVELRMLENFEQVRKGPGVQMYAHSNSYRLPDPAGGINILWGPRSSNQRTWNYWTAPEEFNKLANDLEASTDMAERKKMFSRMLDIFEDEMPMTMLYNPMTSYGVRSTIEWMPYALYYMDLRPDNFSFKKS